VIEPHGAIKELVAALSLEEKCHLVTGLDEWQIGGCERLSIPGWRVSDGPVGVRGRTTMPGQVPALLLPCPSALGATWDAQLVEELGQALGQECLDRRVDLLLGPTVNLHRSPRSGRHFEAFSEDPELTSRLAVAYVTGVQSQGVGACVKHFVVNEQEFARTSTDTRVDERTLRELYLRPFAAVVTEAKARAVMGAYNYVNGEHACSNETLLRDLLKDEWGFDGLVLSDWNAMKETVAPARAGLDVEMPGPGRFWGEGQLADAVKAGDVDADKLDDKVARVLAFLAWRGRLPGETDERPELSQEQPAHRALVRRAAAEASVLLRNEGLLPLNPNRSVALIGPGVASTTVLGGGSAVLAPYRQTSVLDAARARWGAEVVYAEGANLNRVATTVPAEWIGPEGVEAELFDSVDFDGEPKLTQRRWAAFNIWYDRNWPENFKQLSVRLRFNVTPDAGGPYRVTGSGFGRTCLTVDGSVVLDSSVNGFRGPNSTQCGETQLVLEAGRPYEFVLEQHPDPGGFQIAITDVGLECQNERDALLLEEAERVAASAETVVVVVGANEQSDSEGWDRKSLELPGCQDELVRRVRAVNPRTVVVLNCGSPVLLPWLEQVPAALLAWYPGQEAGDAIVDVLLGDVDPGGRMPTTWAWKERDTPAFLHYPGEADVVRYGEELHLGYRWYDARGVVPMIPFGHGGSYTTFEWEPPQVVGDGVDLMVEVPVSNVGERPGSDVIQVYVAPHDPVVVRPVKQLAGWAKVRLAPGQRTIARVQLSERHFNRFDMASRMWTVDPGDYDLVIAASALDERHRLSVEVTESIASVQP
jgi:beta-glucosidase